jgi:hypothetical protein
MHMAYKAPNDPEDVEPRHRFRRRMFEAIIMDRCKLRRYRRLALTAALIGMVLSAGPANAAYQSCPGINVVQSA